MIQELVNYTYTAATKTLVLSDILRVDVKNIQYIENVTTGRVYYNTLHPTAYHVEIINNNLIFSGNQTTSSSDGDVFIIRYDFPADVELPIPPIPTGGTVTSVGISSIGTYGSSLSIGSTPITTSGTITITTNLFNSTNGGIVSPSGGGTTNFLRADGTWATPPATMYTSSAPIILTGSNFSITQATTSTDGYLNSIDWNLFNSKESALTFSTGLTRTVNTITVNTSQNISILSNLTTNGFVKTTGSTGTLSIDTSTYLTTISGIAASGELAATYPSPTLVNSAVIGKLLTGYVSGAGIVSATDSILQAIQKLNGNTAALVTGVSSFNTRTGAITLTSSDVTTALTYTPVPNTTTVAGFALSSNVTLAALTATNTTLTFSGSYDGSTSRTIGLNLSTANSWTGQQTFGTSAPIFSTMTAGSVLFAGTSGLLSQDNANFFYDSTNHRLGLGTIVPGAIVEFASNTDGSIWSTTYSATATAGGGQVGRKARGTLASPTQVLADDVLTALFGAGYTNSSAFSGNTGAIRIQASQNYTSAAQGSYITFATTPNGSTTRAEVVRIDNAGAVSIGNTAGTDKLTVTGNLNLNTSGNKIKITEGTNGSVGQTTLVLGTKAITISGVATTTRAFIQLVTPIGVTSTTSYQAVCTTNTLTIQANIAAGTINVSDVSVVNYFIIN